VPLILDEVEPSVQPTGEVQLKLTGMSKLVAESAIARSVSRSPAGTMSEKNVTPLSGGWLAATVNARPPTGPDTRSVKVPPRQTVPHSGASTEKVPLNLWTRNVMPAAVKVDAALVEAEEKVNVASVIGGGTRGPSSAVIDTERVAAIEVVPLPLLVISKFVGGTAPFWAKIKIVLAAAGVASAASPSPTASAAVAVFLSIAFNPTKRIRCNPAKMNQRLIRVKCSAQNKCRYTVVNHTYRINHLIYPIDMSEI
jgi:hypothetical protein